MEYEFKDGLPDEDDPRIGDNVFIGTGAIIVGKIGSNVIIAANAVVTNDVPDNCYALGTPAKIKMMVD